MQLVHVFDLPKLVFGGGRTALHPYDGLTLYGPYKSPQYTYEEIVIVSDRRYTRYCEMLKDFLKNGYQKYFPSGFNQIFRTDLEITTKYLNSISIDPKEAAKQFFDAFTEEGSTRRFPILIIEKTPRSERYSVYYETKRLFTKNGIPTQFMTRNVLENLNQLKWSLFPMAIQIYAKMGGVPYALASRIGSKENNVLTLVIGVGFSRIHKVPGNGEERGHMYMGFLLMFGPNGEWIAFKSHSEPYDKTRFAEALGRLLVDTVSIAFNEIAGVSEKSIDRVDLIIHYTGKNVSTLEERFLWRASQEISTIKGITATPYIVKLQPSNEYLVVLDQSPCYSAGGITGYPLVGTTIEISPGFYMLITLGCLALGRRRPKANTRGSSPPLLISIKRIENTNPIISDLALIESVFHMCRLNYMSINNPVNKEPVTTKYARELAYMTARLHGKIPDNLAKTLWFI